MNAEIKEVLAVVPGGEDLYEASPEFKQTVDELFSIVSSARGELSSEDYAEFLECILTIAKEEGA